MHVADKVINLAERQTARELETTNVWNTRSCPRGPLRNSRTRAHEVYTLLIGFTSLWWRIVVGITIFLMTAPAVVLAIYHQVGGQVGAEERFLILPFAMMALMGSVAWKGPIFRGLRQLWNSGAQRNLPRLRITIRIAQFAIVAVSVVLTSWIFSHTSVSVFTASVVALAMVSYAALMGIGRAKLGLVPIILMLVTILSAAVNHRHPERLDLSWIEYGLTLLTFVFSVVSLIRFLPPPTKAIDLKAKPRVGATVWWNWAPSRPSHCRSTTLDKVSLSDRLRLGVWHPATDRWCAVAVFFITVTAYFATLSLVFHFDPDVDSAPNSALLGLLFILSFSPATNHLGAHWCLRPALHRLSLMPTWQSTHAFFTRSRNIILTDLMVFFTAQTMVVLAALWVIGTEWSLAVQLIALLWLSNFAATALLLLILQLKRIRYAYRHLLVSAFVPAAIVAGLSMEGSIKILPQVNGIYLVICISLALLLVFRRGQPNFATHE